MRIISIRQAWSLLFVFILSSSEIVAFADESSASETPLTSKIAYHFVGHLEEVDDQGRLLAWKASINGDVTGEVNWWFVQPSPVSSTPYAGGRADYYAARWEIRVDGKLVLAGESAGKTVWRDGEDGIWDGHGVVTEAWGDASPLKGRKVYETGTVIEGPNPPVSFTGVGMFLIY